MGPNKTKGLSGLLRSERTSKQNRYNVSKSFYPRKVIAAQQDVLRRLGDVVSQEPEAHDLEVTWKQIRSHWEATHSLSEVHRRKLRIVPWILFYPPGDEPRWLGGDRDFCNAYFNWLSDHLRPSCIAALIHVFVRDYPKAIPTFESWRTTLNDLLEKGKSVRLEKWRERCGKYSFLGNDGPRDFAAEWLSSSLPTQQVLEEASVSGVLGRSRFLEEAFESLLVITHGMLSTKEMSARALDRVLSLSTHDGALRFPENSNSLASHLLLPFSKKEPAPDIQERIRKFLLDYFGDPRISRSSWHGVDRKARDIMRKWLVRVALEDFFRMLEKAAQVFPDYEFDRHWHHRQAFWSAYLERGHITDAWVLLGPKTHEFAKGILEEHAGAYGTLKGYGVLNNHSVLMMKVAGLTVTEWSHSGKCRLWGPDNKHAPLFYKNEYYRQALVTGADFEQIHHAAEAGTWQRKVSLEIEKSTGVRLKSIDYMMSDPSSSVVRARIEGKRRSRTTRKMLSRFDY